MLTPTSAISFKRMAAERIGLMRKRRTDGPRL